MTHATIFSLDGMPLSEGLQSRAVCDHVIHAARDWAARSGEPVVVEDHGTREAYVITPRGARKPLPSGWATEG